MSGTTSVRPSRVLIATAITGLALGSALAIADESNDVIIEAKAPLHIQHTNEGSPGGARVDLMSIAYHVNMQGLNLSKHADVLVAQEQVKVAAKKACAAIQAAYPVQQMSDARTCEQEATARGMDQLNKLVAGAGK